MRAILEFNIFTPVKNKGLKYFQIDSRFSEFILHSPRIACNSEFAKNHYYERNPIRPVLQYEWVLRVSTRYTDF